MGNQQGSGRHGGGDNHGRAAVPDEPLEAYLREKQRNDHLKNLGLKRHTSFRKSISKKLKRHKKSEGQSSQNEQQLSEPKILKDIAVESVDGVSKCDVHEPFRRPSYGNHSNPDLATSSKAPKKSRKGMENLRKSFRASLRRKKDRDHHHNTWEKGDSGTGDRSSASNGTSSRSSKSKLWQQDEIAVRAGTCNFDVKYMGCVEVFESRGMNCCEEALKKLKSGKKKSTRSILYVNGDGLRVVDFDTKGLLLDQTIEKVSFCAPDHNYDRGFSYICRDGTTRRWMCHGFMAIKETGDRLSHAVGCAFAICLEKKQKRDQECAVSMNFDKNDSTFTRIGSFRQATITERLADPQGIKPSFEPPPKPTTAEDGDANPFAIARPHATDLMLQRQTSFREFSRLQSRTSPFKRQLSLRMSELPSSLERKSNDAAELAGSTNHVAEATVQNPDPFGELCEQFKNQAFFSPSSSVNSSLFTKAELPTVPEDEDISLPPPLMASPIKPFLKPSHTIEALEEESEEHAMESENDSNNANNENGSHNVSKESNNSVTLIPFDSQNPWDLVPDQPANRSSNSLVIPVPPPSTTITTTENGSSNNSNANLLSNDDTMMNNKKQSNNKIEELSKSSSQNLMDDPFDADWVSLALNETTNNHQPL